jgi:hypothetical protein
MRGDALLGQALKARIDSGRNRHAVAVVVGGHCRGFGILRGRVEGAVGQFAHIELVPWHIPIDLVRGNEVEAPALHPALPSGLVLSSGSVASRGARAQSRERRASSVPSTPQRASAPAARKPPAMRHRCSPRCSRPALPHKPEWLQLLPPHSPKSRSMEFFSL